MRIRGLHPSDRILLCGPPSCGKTLTAEVIASELGRPFAIVRTDSVVSSFLGETAANLRKVFDFATAAPMVVLLDEFDALGKEREDASEHGELLRVVNAVLQMLDAYDGRSLIIAATNHEGMLDSAVWRQTARRREGTGNGRRRSLELRTNRSATPRGVRERSARSTEKSRRNDAA